MTQRLDYAVEVHEDEEGPYDVVITLPGGERVVMDPRNYVVIRDPETGQEE